MPNLPTLSMLLAALFAAGAASAEDCDTLIRLNQLGFIGGGAKHAIVASPATGSIRFELVDADGEPRAAGDTIVYGDDPVSGEHIHLADFGAFDDTGSGYRLRAGCAESHPFDIGERPFGMLPYDALGYFYQSRSGIPIRAPYAGEQWARPAGHVHDTATCRKATDRFGNAWHACDYTLDVTGGWYDAGDQGKYVVNGGITVWTLLDFYERQHALGKPDAFSDGQASIPEAGNGVSDLLDEVRFELEFLLAMQAPDGARARVPVGIRRNRPGLKFTDIDASGMAHHKIGDAEWTPLPTPPAEDREPRVLAPVSTGATLNLAAVAAQCARIWRGVDAPFADRCLAAARKAWAAALRNPAVYYIADFGGSGGYGDGDLDDEFFWAAAELFVTTREQEYGDAMRASRYFSVAVEAEPAWPRVAPLGLISLALVPNSLDDAEVAAIRRRLVAAADGFADERRSSGYHIPYASSRYFWGSNSNVLNRAMLLGLAFDFTANGEYRDAAIDAMDYILGRNPLDRSYVSGYGERPFGNPHHRFWAPSFDRKLPPPPPGVLSGGPNSTAPADPVAKELIGHCAPQTCWRDDVRAYSMNEVAINWNAPLVWVAAFLAEPASL